jgi:hypothetical protein
VSGLRHTGEGLRPDTTKNPISYEIRKKLTLIVLKLYITLNTSLIGEDIKNEVT